MNDTSYSSEQLARKRIDQLLRAAGWVIQDNREFNRNAAPGVPVREFRLPAGFCDYLLFVDGRACGVIEAKAEGATLSVVIALPEHLACWADRLIFGYESTGEETWFRDSRDPRLASEQLAHMRELGGKFDCRDIL